LELIDEINEDSFKNLMPEFKRQIIWIKEGLKLYEEIVKVRKILTKFLKILPDSLIFI